jgi:hypothetical protein
MHWRAGLKKARTGGQDYKKHALEGRNKTHALEGRIIKSMPWRAGLKKDTVCVGEHNKKIAR